MQEAYLTKASFKRIVSEREVGKDYRFMDTLVWNHNCGYVITEDQSWIFAKFEIRDLLMYKAFCVDIKEGVKNFYKKIEAHDSWRFIQKEQTPCYHSDADCMSMKSSYQGIIIPEQIRERAQKIAKDKSREAGQLVIDKYRQYWEELEREYKEKYGEDWRATRKYTEYFANRITMRYELDPPIRNIDVEERGNSGVNDEFVDNRSAQEISDSILERIEDLRKWASEDATRLLFFNRYAKLSWLGGSSRLIDNLWVGDNEDDVKKVLIEIHREKEEIIREMKELYMRLYIPDLRFDASFLESIGFRPCWNCCKGVYLLDAAPIQW